MPRFFFDYDSESAERDEDGVELPSVDAARDELRRTLPAVLQDEQSQRNDARVISTVRNAEGHAILVGRITLTIEPSKRAA